MDLLQAFVLAVVQGITEFLPISSSAHLILVPLLTNWDDQGLVFDVAVHLGSLSAVLVYYREELRRLILGFCRAPLANSQNQAANDSARLAWLLVVSTLPIVIAGVFLNDYIETNFRNLVVIGGSSIIFGIILWLAYQKKNANFTLVELTLFSAVIIGVAQALAIIPGASRSGITLTAGLLVGLSVKEAAKYSFLLSIPTIVGAAVFMLVDDYHKVEIFSVSFIVGMLVSALSAYVCIDLFIRFVTRIGMMPFVIYRFLLGLLLISIYCFSQG